MTVNFRLTKGKHLSIAAPLEWCDIPQFAVLTGPNGSGKSQLLLLIFHAARGNYQNHFRDIEMSLTGMQCNQQDVALLDANWNISESPVVTFQHLEILDQTRKQLAAQIKQPGRAIPHIQRWRDTLGDLISSTPDTIALADALPDSISLAEDLNPVHIIQQLGALFRKHHLDRSDLKLSGKTEAEIQELKGPPLWEVANEILAQSSLPYQIISPEKLKLREPYLLQVISSDTQAVISPNNLSSGERVIFSLLVALFTSEKFSIHPRLLLLDEPDAHLHTNQIRAFLHMIRATLVGKYGCRVIMTTHRPDTVIQIAPEALFEMSRTGQPRIRPCTSLSSVVANITAYTVDVIPSIRCVYVEDEDDVEFYTNLRDVLQLHNLLSDIPRLSFCSASLGSGKEKRPGGRGAVHQSVKKLRALGLRMVCGIVDEDGKGVQNGNLSDSVFSIDRYSIENYLYDPLLIYCCLLHHNRALPIPGVSSLAPGDEGKLKSMESSQLQSIIDTIVPMLESHIPDLRPEDHHTQPARLIHGQEVNLPRWVSSIKGHQLEVVMYKMDAKLTRRNLIHMLLCSRIAYQDLCDLLIKIQKHAIL